jgi:exopolyphosphatase/guanosine-5'-triphosphate,3'-diphosphate pyrophosphatase
VAAIDVGSGSIRMVIAQVSPDGKIEVLENLERAARLGQDSFRRGRLTPGTMRAAIAILRDYRRVLDLYSVQSVRAVATSAVREAANAEAFLDRVLMVTGVEVTVIDPSEESRLTVSAVRQDIGKAFDVDRGDVLFSEVGGGSTLLTVLHQGQIAASQSLLLGSIRLQETLLTSSEPPARSSRLLRQQIANVISVNRGTLQLKRIRVFIAMGADARFAARTVGEAIPATPLMRVAKTSLDRLVRTCERQTAAQLGRRYGLSSPEAETLNPALLVHHALLRATRAKEVIVSQVSMRDGLLLDLARHVTGREDPSLWEGVIQSALAVAEKYQADLNHCRNVSHLAACLFDQLQGEHGLKPRHRLLLRVAGLVHEVGGFVSSRAHHKHSYYLVANSEIFGLTREEILTVALIARYHRRSCPKPAHVEYMTVPREIRMVVNKLAALLRVADALDRGHAQQVREIRCERREDELVVITPGVTDLTLERRAVASKGDLFEEIYGLRVRLEEEPAPGVPVGKTPA